MTRTKTLFPKIEIGAIESSNTPRIKATTSKDDYHSTMNNFDDSLVFHTIPSHRETQSQGFFEGALFSKIKSLFKSKEHTLNYKQRFNETGE